MMYLIFESWAEWEST